MSKIGFDSDKYLQLQSQHIRERIAKFGKLYLEFGGKLYDDYHASRVLPGFAPDNKLRMLEQLKDQAEIVIVINADAIEQRKMRGDLDISYDADVLRLKGLLEGRGFYVGSIVITQYTGQPAALRFRQKLDSMGIKAYFHYVIEGYPANVPLIVSDEGYGKNDYIETSRDLIVVTAPGPGSGKMATCLSQLYHENKRGLKAGYAKFETFPVWNLPLSHPVNLAYEAATVDLDDVNMIDPFHFEAYGKTTVNYNRDVEVFPVLQAILEGIMGECPYKSPTDMGVNMVGFAISDDEACREASKQEIIRRYYQTAVAVKRGTSAKSELVKEELLLSKAGCKPEERLVTGYADAKAAESNGPAVAIELPDGRVVTGRTNDLMGAASSCLMNTLKTLAGIPDEEKLVAESAIIPIQTLKTDYLHGKNPRLHTDETLIALSVSAATNADAKKAMDQIPALYGAQAHSTVMLSHVDEALFKKLGIMLTETPVMESRD
ncbi:MAG: DUF1846 domain-containing protein [Lachnospiraceae bacterium]|jgi:uncharacterized protein (UPF0371 family)|nr:DUF1846 domain-containing protein [Lachnospiraceae bacterium]